MQATDPRDEPEALALDVLRRHDGAERIPLLGVALLITVAPNDREGDPTVVAIEWSPGRTEHPIPGSSLWRAVLTQRLAEPPSGDPTEPVLRAQIERSLARYPDLETWWHWLRTGWTAPPVVEAPGINHQPWWRRWRRP